MSVTPVQCPTCAQAASRVDAYCAVCGEPLTQLSWRVDGDWQGTSGRIPVQRDAQQIELQLANQGEVPAAVVLTEEIIGALPAWIEATDLHEQVIQLPAGGEAQTLQIPIDTERLQQSYDQETQIGHELVATISLLSNLRQALKLDLLLVRKPRLIPGTSVYRYLPQELLHDGGTSQKLLLRNESAEALKVLKVEVLNQRDKAPAGYQLLQAEDVLHPVPLATQPNLESSDELQLELQLRWDGTLAEGQHGWFSGIVQVSCQHQQRDHPLSCEVRGTVIRAPRLVPPGSANLTIPFGRLRETHSLTLHNPGDLPVRLGEVHLLGEEGTKHGKAGAWTTAPDSDWLSVRGVEIGDLLPPGGELQLELRVAPEARPRHLASDQWDHRKLVIEHDGWVPAGEPRQLELMIDVEFGRVADRFAAGIDFGTSSSVVCILGDKRAYPLPLESRQQSSGGAKTRERSLASLMYYHAKNDADSGHFLFGQQAYNSAGIDPANLVRSIKTVIARNPETAYHFLFRRHGRYQQVRHTAQQLLDIFIGELLNRAEAGVTQLGPDAQGDLRLQGDRVVFQKAVFSHPVEVTEAMRQALMEAAHNLGVNRDQRRVETFFQERCIDEASAAVLAYVDAREQGLVAPDDEFLPLERVLCFDIGGGTTDLAAVEVRDLDRFAKDDETNSVDHITVELKSNAGFRFGGDDIDVLLAEWLLQQVREQDSRSELLLILDELRYALQARLFNEYQNGFRQRAQHHETWSEWNDAKLENLAIDLYSGASGLLRNAETAKKLLTDADQAELKLTLGPTLLTTNGKDDRDTIFTATIERQTFEQLLRDRLDGVLPLLDSVVERAEWQWPEVTTLLFTGQSVRIPVIRQRVKETVQQRRLETARTTGKGAPQVPPLILVEPGPDVDFDPKHCVAVGAALWQLSREQSRWIRLQTTVHERLTFDLQRPAGRRRYRTVPGLQREVPLPAEANLKEPTPIDRLELYRDRQPYVRFQFEPATHLVIQVRGPADLWIVADGNEIKGEILQ